MRLYVEFEVTDESSDVISNIGHFVDRLKVYILVYKCYFVLETAT